jgi:hypothetical protein
MMVVIIIDSLKTPYISLSQVYTRRVRVYASYSVRLTALVYNCSRIMIAVEKVVTVLGHDKTAKRKIRGNNLERTFRCVRGHCPVWTVRMSVEIHCFSVPCA